MSLETILPEASYENMELRFDINVASKTNSPPQYEVLLILHLKSGETKQFTLKADDVKRLDSEISQIVTNFPKCRRYR
ncbi:unnamed protein product [Bursaphelenchus okinawaensis]|uniref:COMM domain-containing protein n=1 Tax=Bursaphelenchus okinawaensis TaxID=465554 RepID=A0A811LJV6_9BILA|nr:unnamed protein product [Bursaphelenchus okinawaensis]CAG9124433.1 unnamed protein product [Bursaphelenchus okinawaensis]